MNVKKFADNMTQWQSETWHTYACYTHDGGGRLEVNGMGLWRISRKGEITMHTQSQTRAAYVYLDAMPSELQKDFA